MKMELTLGSGLAVIQPSKLLCISEYELNLEPGLIEKKDLQRILF